MNRTLSLAIGSFVAVLGLSLMSPLDEAQAFGHRGCSGRHFHRRAWGGCNGGCSGYVQAGCCNAQPASYAPQGCCTAGAVGAAANYGAAASPSDVPLAPGAPAPDQGPPPPPQDGPAPEAAPPGPDPNAPPPPPGDSNPPTAGPKA